MQTTPTFLKQPRSISLQPPVRITLASLSVIAGLFCALNAIIVALATAALTIAFINFSVVNPFGALLGFVTYTDSALLYGGLTILSFIFAHHIFKKQSISRNTIITAATLIILTLIFQLILLPLFGSILSSTLGA